MLLSAILIAVLATGSQWLFSHLVTRTWLYPIWSGFLVGVFMGKPVEGAIAAATIQLAYLGWITAGGSMPGNLMVAGIFGTAFTLMSGVDPKQAVVYATIFSLVGRLINTAYMTPNALWIHRADKYLENRNIKAVRLMNYLPSGISILLNYLGKKKVIDFFFLGFSQQSIYNLILCHSLCSPVLSPPQFISSLRIRR